jgi:Flp pilus assembly protein TadB
VPAEASAPDPAALVEPAGAPIGVPPDPAAPGAGASSGRGGMIAPLLVYTVLRLGLIVVLTAVLVLFMPLIVALLFAIIVQLPLAYVLFSGPRKRVNAAMAAASAQRRSERERLRAALAGDAPAPEPPAG